jgi:ATP-dependent protease ClpP protease subunit
MPNWNEILLEVGKNTDPNVQLNILNQKRREYFSKIYNITKWNVISYYSGWLKSSNIPQVSINDQDKNAFMSAVYKLDKTKGLDLILHTPGGDVAATESIVVYLKSIFKNDIRAIIPQISMSAGTMIALSCKEIIMGEQSSLGPIDPQFAGIPCQGVLDEFKQAVKEVSENPASLGLWQVIISKLTPTFLNSCENAIKWSNKLAEEWIREVNPEINIEKVKELFLNHKNSLSHSKHMSKSECKTVGLNIIDLENNQDLQDAVLSLHHCYMILFDKFTASKAVENNIGGSYIQNYVLHNNFL